MRHGLSKRALRTAVVGVGLWSFFFTAGAQAAPGEEPLRVALVLGLNKSESAGTPTLRYADDDAIATHRMLMAAGVQSTLLVSPDEDTRRMQGGGEFVHPTWEKVLESFDALSEEVRAANAAGRETEFYFVYSGHGGIEGGEGYIVLENGRLTRSDLHARILERSEATRNQVIIDACKSFFVVFEKGAGGERAFYPGHYVKDVRSTLFRNTGFILSTSSDRDSHEWEKFQAGVFSHEVRSGLWGGADLNADGEITYSELGAFLTTANQGIPNPRYRPDFVIRPPGPPPGELGERIMIWPARQSALVLDRSDLGHVFVENARGERVMDVNVASDDPILLQLPSERPLFVRKGDLSEEFLIEGDGVIELSSITPGASSSAPKGALHLAFEKLFSRTFTAADIATYEECYELYGDPLRLDLVQRFDLLSRTRQVKAVSFWVGGVSGLLGAGSSLWALGLNRIGRNASQAEGLRLNEEIGVLNLSAASFYALAGASALTWLGSHLWPLGDPLTRPEVALVPKVGRDYTGMSLTLGF